MSAEIKVGDLVLCVQTWPARKVMRGMVGRVKQITPGEYQPYDIRWWRWTKGAGIMLHHNADDADRGKLLPRSFAVAHQTHHLGTVFRVIQPGEDL